MPTLKLYATGEYRDSFVSPEVGRLAQFGTHHQGPFWVAAYRKADAFHRLRQLGFPTRQGHLRVARPAAQTAHLLAVPGDVLAHSSQGAVVLVPAGYTAPAVVGHLVAADDDYRTPYHERITFVPVAASEVTT